MSKYKSDADPATAPMAILSLVDLITLASFIWTLRKHDRSGNKPHNWVILDALVLFIGALAFFAIVLQLIALNTVDLDICSLAHQFVGTCHHLAVPLTKTFFSLRLYTLTVDIFEGMKKISISLVTLTIIFCIVDPILLNTIGFTSKIFEDQVCAPVLNIPYFIAFYAIATIFDWANTLALATFLCITVIKFKMVKVNTAILRVVVLTTLSCAIATISGMITLMVAIGIIPVDKPSSVAVVLATDAFANFIAVALPSIAIKAANSYFSGDDATSIKEESKVDQDATGISTSSSFDIEAAFLPISEIV